MKKSLLSNTKKLEELFNSHALSSDIDCTSLSLPRETPDLSIRYLGTAGFLIQSAERRIALDPFLTRPSLAKTLLRPLRPNTQVLRKHLPQVDDVFIGHAHYDHILDAPDLCKQTGARLIGSSSTLMVGRAAGLAEPQMLETKGREWIQSGAWKVMGLPSKHGIVALNRVLLPGDISSPPNWPPRIEELKHGLVLNWLIDTQGLKIMHIDSADFINEELAGHEVDIVCLCAIGRKHRPDYVKDVVRLVKPKWIIPCHWDTMITPYEADPHCLPGVDLEGFINEIIAEGVTPLLMPMRSQCCFHA